MVLLKIGEASKFLGLSPNTLRKYIDNGTIKGVRIDHYRYVEQEELISFQKKGSYKIDLKLGNLLLLCPKCPTSYETLRGLAGHFVQNHPGFKLKDFEDQIKVVLKKEV